MARAFRLWLSLLESPGLALSQSILELDDATVEEKSRPLVFSKSGSLLSCSRRGQGRQGIYGNSPYAMNLCLAGKEYLPVRDERNRELRGGIQCVAASSLIAIVQFIGQVGRIVSEKYAGSVEVIVRRRQRSRRKASIILEPIKWGVKESIRVMENKGLRNGRGIQ